MLFALTGLVKEAEELRAVVALDVADDEGEGSADFGEKALGGAGGVGGAGAKDAQARAGVNGGELEGLPAVGEAQVFGVHLDEGAGEGFPQCLVGTFALSGETAQALGADFGEEEVVLFEYASEGGGREAEAVALKQKDGELDFAPDGNSSRRAMTASIVL